MYDDIGLFGPPAAAPAFLAGDLADFLAGDLADVAPAARFRGDGADDEADATTLSSPAARTLSSSAICEGRASAKKSTPGAATPVCRLRPTWM